MKKIHLLDCTLRDGGFALEGARKIGMECSAFNENIIKDVISYISDAEIDIVEIGTVENVNINKGQFAIYKSIEEISKYIPAERNLGQQYSMFFRGPDIPLEFIPVWKPEYCDIIRLSLRYSELRKSLDYCKGLAVKGYKVSIQPAITMRYTKDELKLIIDAANDMHAYSVYFVDSYGYMDVENIRYLFNLLDKDLMPSIKIGFHAHNNLNLAMRNVIEFIEQNSCRDIIIDSCCLGMGQGAGNLQTEVIVNYLNENCNKDYKFLSVLKACDIIGEFWNDNVWGYSVETMISAAYKVAYGYAIALRNEYKFSFEKIALLLKEMPDEFKHRYTKDNIIKLLELSENV